MKNSKKLSKRQARTSDSDNDDEAPQTSKKFNKEQQADDLRRIKETEDMDELIELSQSENPLVRIKAAQQMCPCRVGKDYEAFWTRTFELAQDEDAQVRYQILHNMCDGSPDGYEEKVAECLEIFNRDEDKEIRRRAHKVLASYLRTGKWNVL